MSNVKETLRVVSNLAAASFDVDETDALLDAVCDYGLAVHVAACEEYVFVEPTTVDPSQWIPCGQEDIYCDDAKEILELGKQTSTECQEFVYDDGPMRMVRCITSENDCEKCAAKKLNEIQERP